MSRPVVADGVVYASSGSGMTALRAGDGRPLWSVEPAEGFQGVTPALDAYGLYAPAGKTDMVSFGRADGAPRWRFPAEGGLESSPVLLGDRLYFGSAEACALYCLNTLDGSLIWKVRTELEPDAVAAAAGVLVASTQDLHSSRAMLLALDAATGRELWRFFHRLGASAPSIAGARDAVIFGGGDLHAYALDLEHGRPLWRSKVEGAFGIWSSPTLAFDDAFLADRTGNVYRLKGGTGERRWIFRGARGTMDRSSPLITGGSVLIGSGAGELFAWTPRRDACSGRGASREASCRGTLTRSASTSESHPTTRGSTRTSVIPLRRRDPPADGRHALHGAPSACWQA